MRLEFPSDRNKEKDLKKFRIIARKINNSFLFLFTVVEKFFEYFILYCVNPELIRLCCNAATNENAHFKMMARRYHR